MLIIEFSTEFKKILYRGIILRRRRHIIAYNRVKCRWAETADRYPFIGLYIVAFTFIWHSIRISIIALSTDDKYWEVRRGIYTSKATASIKHISEFKEFTSANFIFVDWFRSKRVALVDPAYEVYAAIRQDKRFVEASDLK